MVPFLAALLTFVAAAVAAALAILLPGGRGLNAPIAVASLAVGLLAGWGAFLHTRRLPANQPRPVRGASAISPWGWAVFTVFALFALRSFCWLVYENNAQLFVGNANNLGDISLHLLYAHDFANGTRWWPEHPQAAGYSMRYYPGIDLFQALLLVLGADDLCSLVWVGLAGSLLTALALYRWGGSFTVAGFLFAGGMAGRHWFHSEPVFHLGELVDFQAEMAWKSLPLAIFVTQRPFLFALPAGLLLMAHWREKFFADPPLPDDAATAAVPWSRRGLIPFWVECLLYTVMPAFHLFAFLFLSVLLGGWFAGYFARTRMRWHLLGLVGVALLPATGLVWLMTDHFAAGAGIKLQVGWMQHKEPFRKFWLENFGLFALLGPALWLWCAWVAMHTLEVWSTEKGGVNRQRVPPTSRGAEAAGAFVLPAGVLFLAACVWLFAPWEWDNTKLMIWCYLAALPFVWERCVRPLVLPLRVTVCGLLFFSGALTLAGGLRKPATNLRLIERVELDSVRMTVRDLPAEARFAAAPDYNHPLVYSGRKVAMGYDGHLHSQGIDYLPLSEDLDTLMRGDPAWQEAARRLEVRYVFWGPREEKRYPNSTLPWADPDVPVAKGDWGTVYEIHGADRR